MKQNLNQAQTQPFVKLAQANMDLFTRFSSSPEVAKQTTAYASQLFLQASESATKLMQSEAFADMMQGMLKSYIEFLTELTQSGMGMLSESEGEITHQVQEAARGVIEATDARSRRVRQAA